MAEHVCSLIKIIEGDDGRKIEYISPSLRDIDKIDNSKLDDLELLEKIVNNIKSIAHCLGMFSSKLVGVCEFDNKPTDNLIEKILEDADLFDSYYPYNTIWLDKKNEWKFACLKKYYHINKNILFLDETFPKIVNIKRSSGKIQKALVNNTHAVGLYKTSKDNYKELHIGIKIHFHKEKDITEDCNISNCEYRKIVLLDTLIELNPEINCLDLKFQLINPDIYLEQETIENKNIVENVITYFNNIYKKWLHENITKKLNEHDINFNIDIQ